MFYLLRFSAEEHSAEVGKNGNLINPKNYLKKATK